MPVNIRLGFYKTREDIKVENKFAGMPLTVPLTESMETSYDQITKVTQDLKGAMGCIYAMYVFFNWSGKISPRFILN